MTWSVTAKAIEINGRIDVLYSNKTTAASVTYAMTTLAPEAKSLGGPNIPEHSTSVRRPTA
jgi:hypothetical protein